MDDGRTINDKIKEFSSDVSLFSFNQNKLWTNWRSKGLFYTTNPIVAVEPACLGISGYF
jgi:hypothetical protein